VRCGAGQRASEVSALVLDDHADGEERPSEWIHAFGITAESIEIFSLDDGVLAERQKKADPSPGKPRRRPEA
jgi:hypothetical protein